MEEDLRRYVERTYCSGFEEEGWIHVRKSEVQAYRAQVKRRHDVVQCDDGTPLDELGAR